MRYGYDQYGWFSGPATGERSTDLAPPAHGNKVVGQPFPNFTGTAWVQVPYAESPLPAPSKPPLTKLAFRSRFTNAEKAAIYTAAKTNIQLQIWLDDLASASEVDLTFPATVAGVQALEAAGLIGAGRAAIILGNYIDDLR